METRIKDLRRETRITQHQLSKQLGVSQESISAYEMGKYLPSLTILMRMSDIFGVAMDYIMNRSDVKQPIKEECIETQEAQLLSEFRKLSPLKREKAVAYMQGLNDE